MPRPAKVASWLIWQQGSDNGTVIRNRTGQRQKIVWEGQEPPAVARTGSRAPPLKKWWAASPSTAARPEFLSLSARPDSCLLNTIALSYGCHTKTSALLSSSFCCLYRAPLLAPFILLSSVDIHLRLCVCGIPPSPRPSNHVHQRRDWRSRLSAKLELYHQQFSPRTGSDLIHGICFGCPGRRWRRRLQM
jgi:hypothetical protein